VIHQREERLRSEFSYFCRNFRQRVMEAPAHEILESDLGQISSTDVKSATTAAVNIDHKPSESESCRCGCVPPDMMSLFQMAALRAKYRENIRIAKAEEAQSKNVADVAQINTTS
jgi:hypothetical protein